MQYLVQPTYKNAINYPGVIPGKHYTFAILNSGLVAAVDESSNRLVLKQWTEDAHEIFCFQPTGDGGFKILCVGTGYVIDGMGRDGANNGVEVCTWSGNDQPWQIWDLIYLGGSNFRIQTRNGGRVLSAKGGSKEAGTRIVQWTWGDGLDQKFRVAEVQGNHYKKTYGAKATVCESVFYQGKSVQLGLGWYKMSEIGLPIDAIHSLKVPENLRVTIYQDSLTGIHGSFCEDIPGLGGVNNRTASLLVEVAAAVYPSPKFIGKRAAFGVGQYLFKDLAEVMGEGRVNSIRLPQGMQIELYDQDDFKGEVIIVNCNCEELTPVHFHDRTKSMIVKMIGATLPETPVRFGDKLILKTHHNNYLTMHPDQYPQGLKPSETDPGAPIEIVRAGATNNQKYLCYGDVVYLRSYQNTLMLAFDTHQVNANSTNLQGNWEKFVVVRAGDTESRSFVGQGDRIAFRTWHHTYLMACDDGMVRSWQTVIGGWETFTITKVIEGTVEGTNAEDDQAIEEEEASACGTQACGVDACASQACAIEACAADACGVAMCKAQGNLITACGAAVSGVVLCGADASGIALCAAEANGITVCGANTCGVAACAAAGCGADACGAAACAMAACAAAGCGAAGCGANGCPMDLCGAAGCAAAGCGVAACPGNVCGAAACAADGCAVALSLVCPVDACGANACAIDLCPIDACAADACAIDLIPFIPGI